MVERQKVLSDNDFDALTEVRVREPGRLRTALAQRRRRPLVGADGRMLLLAAEDPEKDIWLYINSPGGSVTAGMAIFDTMQWVPNDVATVAMGMAASMGQFLLSAGTPGKRYATPHARVMMHQPSGGIGGTASDIKIQAQQMLHVKNQMAELIARHTGQPLEQIEKDSDRDRWFTADEAMAYGFVDHVYTSADQAPGGAGTGA